MSFLLEGGLVAARHQRPRDAAGRAGGSGAGDREPLWQAGAGVGEGAGEGFAKQIVDYGPIGTGQGCGIQFAVADLRGSGRLDIVAPGKEGLAVFFNETPA